MTNKFVTNNVVTNRLVSILKRINANIKQFDLLFIVNGSI